MERVGGDAALSVNSANPQYEDTSGSKLSVQKTRMANKP